MLRVLHVDDEPEVLNTVADTLLGNATVVGVGSIVAAKVALAEGGAQTFDVILLDLGLPDSKGAASVAALTGYGLPIVVFTGSTSHGGLMDALEAGAEDYLVKPLGSATRLIDRLAFAHRRHQRARKAVAAASGGSTSPFGAKKGSTQRFSPARFDAMKPFLVCSPS